MGENCPSAVVNPVLSQVSSGGQLHCHVAGQSLSSLDICHAVCSKASVPSDVVSDIGGFPCGRNLTTMHPESQKILPLVLWAEDIVLGFSWVMCDTIPCFVFFIFPGSK
jgi:hypothetical protein